MPTDTATSGRRHRLLAAVGVHEEEVKLTRWIAALFAVTQASHGVGANAADALFFLRFGVEDLPLMILLSGPAVMIAIIAHSAGLARRGARGWLWVTMSFSAVWVVLLWLGVFTGEQLIYPVIWISTQVLILVTLTVMWNAAGAACTTRQAKRLFPIFATAAVAGGVVGNLAVGPMAALFGTQNLLVVQTLLLVGATLVLSRAAGFFTEDTGAVSAIRDEMREAITAVRSSRLLGLCAAAIFLFGVLFFIVVFPFSEVVAGSFETEAEVAGFLGVFSSIATAATALFSLLVTNRLFARLGLVLTLVIVPVVYVAGFSVWLVAFGLVTATVVRGAQWIAVNAIQGTAYSALFNVLSSRRRGPVMALMLAVPAQLGTMGAGVILIAGESLSQTAHFGVGLGLAGLALAVMLAMRPAYLAAVVSAVKRGLVGVFDVPQAGLVTPIDGDAARVLKAHLTDSRPRARAIAVAGLARLGDGTARNEIEPLLDDEDPLVRSAAFDSICAVEPEVIDSHLDRALADESADVRLNALRYVASTGADRGGVATLARVLDDPDPRVRAATAWLVGGEAGRGVVDHMASEDSVRSIMAVLDEVARSPDETMGVDPERYIDHTDPGVRARAVTAHAAVDGDLSLIVPALEDTSLRVRQAAATALARTESGRAHLLTVLREGGVVATEAALHALAPFEDTGPEFTDWAANEARRAAYLLDHRRSLDGRIEYPEGEFLIRVLDNRVGRLVQWVLVAMTTAKTREVMGIVGRGVRTDDPETNAQAIEALESIGERSVLEVLLPLLEPTASAAQSGDHRASLHELSTDFDPWLRALALRCLARDAEEDLRRAGEVAAGDESVIARRAVPSLALMPEEDMDTLDQMDRVLVLQRVPMFSDLDPEDLLLIAGASRESRFDAGELIYREGDPGTELLVIVDGMAVVSRLRHEQRRVIESYGEGDHVGELSLLYGGPRSADVHAGDDGLRGLLFTKADLLSILEERPSVALGMLSTLAARLVEQT